MAAPLDFPPNAGHPAAPALGEKWPQPPVAGQPIYTWDGEKWTTIGGDIGSIGGADDPPLMDGTAAVGTSLQWAREDHVHPTDTGIAGKLSLGGGTLTGPLFLPATTPTGATQATTKSYVDSVAAPVPPFPAGTVMVFYNAAAPTGWTKITAGSDNRALRVVSGSGGTGGGVQNFSTVFGRTGTDNFTLSTTEMPYHQHLIAADGAVYILWTGGGGSYEFTPGGNQRNPATSYLTGASGSSGTHSHTIDLRVLYLDVILCSKN